MGTDLETFSRALSAFFGDEAQEDAMDRRSARERNLRRILDYFGAIDGPPFDGSLFEFYGAQETHPYRITPADLVAVTFLSMEIRRDSRYGISTTHARIIEERVADCQHLLVALPTDRDLHELTDDEYEDWVGPGSAGDLLWDVLREEVGMYQVATFKLMARKRPRLFPIADSRTRAILGNPENWWENWYRALRGDARDVVKELRSLRAEAAQTIPAIHAVSLLRIADIALWNDGSAETHETSSQ